MLRSLFFNVDRDMNFVGHLINFYDASHPFFFFFLEKQISPEWTRKKGCFFVICIFLELIFSLQCIQFYKTFCFRVQTVYCCCFSYVRNEAIAPHFLVVLYQSCLKFMKSLFLQNFNICTMFDIDGETIGQLIFPVITCLYVLRIFFTTKKEYRKIFYRS